ncbi:MAG TPA: polysaccharide deacetylase family protein [Bradyrhizobium sp.]|jgi:peptidoglycan/xylan/chitin deacetylase (PgdA/CDA1 family)|nr:polysaccharide deacetylase family protein [Bradyrhizobium sp.]
MLKEYHYAGKFSWPNDQRVAVALTFDFQGGEDVRPGADGKMDHEEYTQAEYGPHTAIWRILRILEEEGVKGTFNTCGGIAERYPAAVKAIVSKGHEIAGHGYHHEVARDLTREQEIEVMRRTTAMIRSTTGHTPVGWRSCTQSPNSLELLMEHGYLFNSNSFSHDLPFLWEGANGGVLVELPRQPFGDGRTYQHRNNDAGNPHDTLLVWKAMFDELYDESKIAPTYVPFQFHPYISGRPGRANTLRNIIRHMKKDGVWFATGSEVARWCLDEVFKVGKAAPQKAAS